MAVKWGGRGPGHTSRWTKTVSAADTTAPTITSSATANCAENAQLAHALTANESVTWAIRTSAQDAASVDYAQFALTGSTLTWVGNGTQDYETPLDTGANNTYVVVVRATDGSSNTTDQTITITVTDVSEAVAIWTDNWEAGTTPSGVTASGGANGSAVQSDGYWAADTCPRFHHDWNTLTLLGVLCEGARTNIALQSNDLATTWAATSSAVTANAATGPFGATSADQLADQNLGTNGSAFVAQTIGVTVATAYACSILTKKGTLGSAYNWMGINHTNYTTPPTGVCFFDHNTPAVGTMNTGCTGTQRQFGTGWWRNCVTYTSDAADNSGSLRINLSDGDTDTTISPRDGTHDILVAHVQLEAVTTRVFPSSPIITTTASVTRSADSLTRTGADFSTGWSSTAGLITFTRRLPYLSGTQVLWCAYKAADPTNYYIMVYATGSTIKLKIVSGGVTQCDVGTRTVTDDVDFDVAASWTANDFRISVDGAADETDTSGSVPAGLDTLRYGNDGSGTDPMFGILRGSDIYYDSAPA